MNRPARSIATFLLLVLCTGCARESLFTDAGEGNGTSVAFALPRGAFGVDYIAHDREPWQGCRFGIALVAQGPDPLAPGRPISDTGVIAVSPRAELRGGFATPPLAPGVYFLGYLGDQPCDWSVSVTGAIGSRGGRGARLM